MLNQAGGTGRSRNRPGLPLASLALATTGVTLSTVFLRRQQQQFHAACSWDIASAALATAIVPLTWPEARAALRELREPAGKVIPIDAQRHRRPRREVA